MPPDSSKIDREVMGARIRIHIPVTYAQRQMLRAFEAVGVTPYLLATVVLPLMRKAE
jgi:hypothetical protein